MSARARPSTAKSLAIVCYLSVSFWERASDENASSRLFSPYRICLTKSRSTLLPLTSPSRMASVDVLAGKPEMRIESWKGESKTAR